MRSKHKYSKIIILFLGLLPVACSKQQDEPLPIDYTQYVDPHISSVHGRWFFYTPAAIPFGMAKLAPHTNAYGSDGGWGPVGYDDRHSSIEGFGHFHEFQVGGLVFMPVTGELKTVPGTLEDPDKGYRSRFKKDSEVSEPGYYRVMLDDYGTEVELTATERVGFHRYRFPGTDHARVIIDIGHKQGESSDITHAEAHIVNENEVEGFIESYPEYAKFCDPGKTVRMYFVARLSQSPAGSGSFRNRNIYVDSTSTKGSENGLWLDFDFSEGGILEIQTGLSYTSVENARINLKAEGDGITFDDARASAKEKWNEMLGRIKVEGGKQEDRTKFYTGLYHALLGRGVSSDVNGQYPLVDHRIGQIPLDENGKPKYKHYNTDGIWGGFWNLTQLWSLAYPDYYNSYIQSNIDFYEERGWLHDGEANGVYTNGVQTNFQGLVLAAAYNLGIRDYDVETGYQAALKNELEYHGRHLGNGKYDLSYFVKNGYVPYKDTVISNGWVFNFGASHTMEYAFSSYAVGQMAKKLGDSVNFERLATQAAYWQNLFDEETRLIRPKLESGEFITDFDPNKAWDGFQEGNAYQYTWYVPHDPAGLIEMLGIDTFNTRLERIFVEAEKGKFGTAGEEIASFSGIEQLYNHGNQPSLHNAWLFNYSGKPWLTQKWVRVICDQFYGTTALYGYGVGQDEDQGQLGAWYVMAALGLFDVQGLTNETPTFQFGSPLFEKVTIALDPGYYSGDKLVLETGGTKRGMYIQTIDWNGQKLDRNWIAHKKLMQGGVLTFTLGDKPNYDWGISPAPPSMSSTTDGL